MKKRLLRLHLYGGLVCACYMVIFGVSSFLSNHPTWAPAPGAPIRWEKAIATPVQVDNVAYGRALTGDLGVTANVLYLEVRRAKDGTLRYLTQRPGKHYTVHVSPDGKTAQVDEEHLGLLQITHALHGMMRTTARRLLYGWGWYTRLCTLVMVFAAVSGVYLFVTRNKQRLVDALLLTGAAATSLGLMICLPA